MLCGKVMEKDYLVHDYVKGIEVRSWVMLGA